MKKLSFTALVSVLAMAVVSCGNAASENETDNPVQETEECAEVSEPCENKDAEQEAARPDKDPVASYAVQIMETFYKAAATDDFDAYCAVDYEAGEMDGYTTEEWDRYSKAEQQWKKDNDQKWNAIKEYRKKKIAEGYVLTIVDME